MLLLLLHSRQRRLLLWKRPQSVDEINRDAEIDTAAAAAAGFGAAQQGREEEADHTRCNFRWLLSILPRTRPPELHIIYLSLSLIPPFFSISW